MKIHNFNLFHTKLTKMMKNVIFNKNIAFKIKKMINYYKIVIKLIVFKINNIKIIKLILAKIYINSWIIKANYIKI